VRYGNSPANKFEIHSFKAGSLETPEDSGMKGMTTDAIIVETIRKIIILFLLIILEFSNFKFEVTKTEIKNKRI